MDCYRQHDARCSPRVCQCGEALTNVHVGGPSVLLIARDQRVTVGKLRGLPLGRVNGCQPTVGVRDVAVHDVEEATLDGASYRTSLTISYG